jgi:hypothetical protein
MQAVQRIASRLLTDKDDQATFKHLAKQWQDAESIKAGEVTVRTIEKKFPQMKHWLVWWSKRAHLIINAVMKEHKPLDIMQNYPTTDNTLESFHAKYKHMAPREYLPIFLFVNMIYNFVENVRRTAQGIVSGTVKPNRKRKQAPRGQNLSKSLIADEWIEPRPEMAQSKRSGKTSGR